MAPIITCYRPKLPEVGTISIISPVGHRRRPRMALAPAFAKCGTFSRNRRSMGGYAEYAFGNPVNFMANYNHGVLAADRQRGYRHPAVGYNRIVRRRADAAQTVWRLSPYCGFVPSQTLAARVLPTDQ